jgi:RNA recognition motif-containing protein
MNTKIYVGNIPNGTTEEELRYLFSTVGGVISVKMVKDKATGKPKGFAFVEMMSQGDAGKAVSEFNGYRMNQQRLKVMAAKPGNQQVKSNTGYVEYKSYHDSVLPPYQTNRRS